MSSPSVHGLYFFSDILKDMSQTHWSIDQRMNSNPPIQTSTMFPLSFYPHFPSPIHQLLVVVVFLHYSYGVFFSHPFPARVVFSSIFYPSPSPVNPVSSSPLPSIMPPVPHLGKPNIKAGEKLFPNRKKPVPCACLIKLEHDMSRLYYSHYLS